MQSDPIGRENEIAVRFFRSERVELERLTEGERIFSRIEIGKSDRRYAAFDSDRICILAAEYISVVAVDEDLIRTRAAVD